MPELRQAARSGEDNIVRVAVLIYGNDVQERPDCSILPIPARDCGRGILGALRQQGDRAYRGSRYRGLKSSWTVKAVGWTWLFPRASVP